MSDHKRSSTTDTLTQTIGVLTRREVEARILMPVVEALGRSFGRDEVIRIVSGTIVEIARQQGAELADAMGGDTSRHFTDSLAYWTQDEALAIEVHEKDGRRLDFDVTRCRYAEMYRALGMPELGKILSCNRDFALIEGFNPRASLSRTQTIMEGAPFCDFRYRFPPAGNDK